MNFATFLRHVAAHVRGLRGPHSNYLQDVRTTAQIRRFGFQQKIHDDARLLARWLKHERPGQRNMAMVELQQVLEAIRRNLLDLLRYDYERGLISGSDNFDDREMFQQWHKQCERIWRWLDSCFRSFDSVHAKLLRIDGTRMQAVSETALSQRKNVVETPQSPPPQAPIGKKPFSDFYHR